MGSRPQSPFQTKISKDAIEEQATYELTKNLEEVTEQHSLKQDDFSRPGSGKHHIEDSVEDTPIDLTKNDDDPKGNIIIFDPKVKWNLRR